MYYPFDFAIVFDSKIKTKNSTYYNFVTLLDTIMPLIHFIEILTVRFKN